MTQPPTHTASPTDASVPTDAALPDQAVTRSVVSAVVGAVADVEGVDSGELDGTLYRAVDADAVAALVAHEVTDWQLRFPFGDHDVTVRGGGTVVVDERTFPNAF
jgi:hypothetical protein